MRVFAILGLVLLCWVCPALSQTTTGSLDGRIRDGEGVPVAFANVVVSGPALQGNRGVMSTSAGYFFVPNLPAGTYSVKFMHVSHQELTVEGVIIRLGKTTTMADVSLQSKMFETDAVVVTDTKPPVDVKNATISSNLTAEQMEVLPLERDYRSAIAFLPQANNSAYGDATNIAGSTGSENAYYVEGMNVTDPYLAVTSMSLPPNFVKEIQLVTGGYQAEHGRATGGIVNVVTLTGGNDFEGSIFGFFTNNSLTADIDRGPTALTLGDYARYDVGVALSGPIKKDRLWYFAAYDPSFRVEDLEIPGFGFFQDKEVSHQFAGKLTWKASQRTTVNLVAIGNPTERDYVGANLFNMVPRVGLANPDPFLGKQETGGFSTSIDGQHLFNDRFMLDGAVYLFEQRNLTQPATQRGWDEPLFTDFTTGIWSGGYAQFADHQSTRVGARLAATALMGNHEIKVGVEYEDNVLDSNWKFQTSDGRDSWVVKGADSLYFSNTFLWEGTLHNRIPSAFMQDSWQAMERLRLNAGLRWDGFYQYDINGNQGVAINDQFQPRVGFVYQPGELGSQRVFGSYGRFYEQVPTFVGTFLSPFYQIQVRYNVDPVENYPVQGDTVYLATTNDTRPLDDIKGQHFDEFILGYERRVGGGWRVGVHGIHREIREIIDDVVDPDNPGRWLLGNPGRNELDYMPDPIRRYTALELSLDRSIGARYLAGVSYVLSRSYGNYPGVFNSDTGVALANAGPAFDTPRNLINAEGRLPNDRPHVFKAYGSYMTRFGLTAGAFFIWQSGTPLNEYASGLRDLVFVSPRGSFGRTPDIWDLNLRFTYILPGFPRTGLSRPRVLFDIFHLFSQKEPILFDQTRYLAVDADGTPVSENPFFMRPLAFQPPMVMRMGIEAGF